MTTIHHTEASTSRVGHRPTAAPRERWFQPFSGPRITATRAYVRRLTNLDLPTLTDYAGALWRDLDTMRVVATPAERRGEMPAQSLEPAWPRGLRRWRLARRRLRRLTAVRAGNGV